jgi:hypothetical protein
MPRSYLVVPWSQEVLRTSVAAAELSTMTTMTTMRNVSARFTV